MKTEVDDVIHSDQLGTAKLTVPGAGLR